MKKQLNRSELLGSLPVKRAVLMQILPAIASQMVALAYGIADTYFVGLLNDPDKTAAVTVANAAFLMLTALSNLFGIGGASLIARLLGAGKPDKAREVSVFCFYSGLLSAAVFGAAVGLFNERILLLCGARGMTLEYAKGYVFYTLTLGCLLYTSDAADEL